MTNLNYFPCLLITNGNNKERIKKAQEVLGFKINENNPDFFWLKTAEEKNSIGIEDARQMQKFLMLKPYAREKKSVLVEGAETLTLEAQNALLKTLEEPPANSQIILTLPDESLLLPTIVSRCQLITLNHQSQINLTDKEEKEIKETLESLMTADIPERLLLGEVLSAYKGKSEAINWLDKLTWVSRKILLLNYQENLASSSQKKPNLKYLNLLKLISQTKKMLQANVNVKLALDSFLIEI
jgi:DNA polymerase III delta prime subunit